MLQSRALDDLLAGLLWWDGFNCDKVRLKNTLRMELWKLTTQLTLEGADTTASDEALVSGCYQSDPPGHLLLLNTENSQFNLFRRAAAAVALPTLSAIAVSTGASAWPGSGR